MINRTRFSGSVSCSHQSGFALVALAAVLIIVGLVAGSLLLSESSQQTWDPRTNTETRIEDVNKALVAYQRRNGRLPCPASRIVDTSATGFGEEAVTPANCNAPGSVVACSCDSSTAGVTQVAGQDAGTTILIGALPVRALGLTDDAMRDDNGMRLTYAVTEAMTTLNFGNAEGQIRVVSASNANQIVADDQAYLVLSHGEDIKGAWPQQRAGLAGTTLPPISCTGAININSFGQGYKAPAGSVFIEEGDQKSAEGPGGGNYINPLDIENCTDNFTFAAHELNVLPGQPYYDDLMTQAPKDLQAAAQVKHCLTGSVSWTVGAATCSGTIPAPGIGNQNTSATPQQVTVNDNIAPTTGAATFICSNGAPAVQPGATCVGATALTCALPWGGTINAGDSVTAYSAGTAPCGAGCASETRTCVDNGNGTATLSGSYVHQQCTVDACPTSCALPWGGTLAAGASITAYQSSGVACGETCQSQTRTCVDNGNGTFTLSGSFTHQACSVASCSTCTLPWGGTINHGASVNAFATSSVACGQTCQSESRSCSNGTLSGSYTHQTCSAPNNCNASCSLGGHTIPHGQSRTFYREAFIACGASTGCDGITRTCNNGVLDGDGSYVNDSCTVLPCGGGGSCTDGETTESFQEVGCDKSCIAITSVCVVDKWSPPLTGHATCDAAYQASCPGG